MENNKIVHIAGAGLVGSLLSIMLGREGYQVKLLEKRSDPRKNMSEEGRSINLALSHRGWKALKQIGLYDSVKEKAIPMKGRMLHATTGEIKFQPYGLVGQQIYSVSRGRLNKVLLDAAEENHNVQISFQQRCEHIELDQQKIWLNDLQKNQTTAFDYNMLIGCDGAFSAVRQAMQKNGRFNYSQQFLEHGYKELTIPPQALEGFAMEPHALHIWPRKEFMLIALPNPDCSFTATLFLPYNGPISFEQLKSKEDVLAFFEEYFPDVIPLAPALAEEFECNPTASLVTIGCSPWAFEDSALIIGDAAHAIVPFYGQGMNSGFEDCTIYMQLLKECHFDINKASKLFAKMRKQDADAIAELALRNFIEMRDLVADPNFLLRKKIESVIQQQLPEVWQPLYSMVTFSDIPYSHALAIGKKQNAVMKELMKKPDIANNYQLINYQQEPTIIKYMEEVNFVNQTIDV